MNSWIDTTSALSTSIRFGLKREIFPSSLILRPNVPVFVWKGRFVLPLWSFVHTHPFLFQKEIFPSGLIFRPHVSVFVLRGRFFPSVWSFIHTYPFLFEKVFLFFFKGRKSVNTLTSSTLLLCSFGSHCLNCLIHLRSIMPLFSAITHSRIALIAF